MLSRHYRCASHTLNLLATVDFAKILDKNKRIKTLHSKVLSKCEMLWKNLKSPKTREVLSEYLKISLKRPVVTRWNALYDALKQIFELKNKLLSSDLEAKVKYFLDFKEEDFDYIQFYLDVMKSLADTLVRLQGEKQCYYGCLLPNLILLRLSWINLAANLTDCCKPVVEQLIFYLEKRFKQFFDVEGNGEIAAVAALSHPQFKTAWLHCLSPEAQEKVFSILNSPLLNDEVQKSQLSTVPSSFIYDFGQATNDSSLMRMINRSVEQNEFLSYLKSQCTSDFTCLNSYPQVKEIFLKYNTPLPSSAPVERLFSYATLLNLPRYNRLTDKKFEKRILLKINLNRI